MSRTLRHRLTGLAALASMQALMLGGTALAQGHVQIFEEPPPMALLRSIMVPESRPGLTRRIVITQPDRPASMLAEAVGREPGIEPAASQGSGSRRQRWQQPAMDAGPVMASARLPEPAPEARPVVTPAAEAGSVGFRINFALNSDVVPQSAFPFVERIAELLRDQPQVKLQVEGHTDALGTDAYNLALSQRRAVAVANHLVERQGIEPSRLVVVGRGEEAPLSDNAFDPRNRRVQFARVE
jgi:outer membrane protein OmpA-like peptidoglycan-associated protein